MNQRFFRLTSATIGLLVGSAAIAMASSSGPIGFAWTSDAFLLNGIQVHGNASLLNGSVVRATDNPVWITLHSGARVALATKSSGAIFSDHIVLEEGTSQAKGFAVVAQGMRISPDTSALIRVATAAPKTVSVTAVSGNASVFNRHGLLIADMRPGRSLAFTDQDTGAGAPTQITGCIERISGTSNFVIRDETTNVVYQVSGPDVEANVGKTVQVTGTPDTSATVIEGASQLIRVSALTPLNRRGCKSDIPAAAAAVAGGGAAAAAGAGAAAGGGGAAGISGVTVAIIAGVGAAGVIGGLAAAGTFSSGAASPVSQ